MSEAFAGACYVCTVRENPVTMEVETSVWWKDAEGRIIDLSWDTDLIERLRAQGWVRGKTP